MSKMLIRGSLLLIALISFMGLIYCEDLRLVEVMKTEVEKLSETFQGDCSKLINDFSASSDFLVDSVLRSEVESVTRYRYKLPSQVVEKFKGMDFTTNVKTQSFALSISPTIGIVEEYVGAAYLENEYVRLSYMKVAATGILIPQYTTLQSQACWPDSRFLEKCLRAGSSIVRGYSAEEIQIISSALRAHGYINLNDKMKDLKSDSQFVLLAGNKMYSATRQTYLTMQDDGNAVAYKMVNGKPVPLWATNTNIPVKTTYSLQVKASGTVQIWAPNASKYLWEAYPLRKGEGPYFLLVHEDGNVVLYDRYRKPLWDGMRKYGDLEFLLPQNTYLFSANGLVFGVLQNDGSFRVYSVKDKNSLNQSTIIWGYDNMQRSTGPYTLVLDKEGKVSILAGNGSEVVTFYGLWSNYEKIPPYKLILNEKGALVLIDSTQKVVWTTR